MRQRPQPENNVDHRFMALIDEHGWAIRFVWDNEGYDVMFLDVGSRRASVENDYATWTDRHYEPKGFPLKQLAWPDKAGIFPWQHGFREELRRLQPNLGNPPMAL